MAADLLVADRLTRKFDARVAVRDLSLAVASGEVVALLGPNGAGKTTTMRMLAGLILPTAGRITIDRIEITSATADLARRAIGLLTEAPGLWERLTVKHNLLTYARLQGLDAPESEVDRVLGEVDLADRANDAAGSLSKGLKQRVAIARALIHRPPIMLLDEPTSGLDPASARHIRDMILALKQNGRAVLVSTHNLAEAEELADRIAVLNTQLVALDTPAALRGGIGGGSVTIEVEGPASSWAATVANGEATGSRLRVPIESLADVPGIVDALVAAGARIIRVTPERRTLEEVYLDLVGEPE